MLCNAPRQDEVPESLGCVLCDVQMRRRMELQELQQQQAALQQLLQQAEHQLVRRSTEQADKL